VILNYKLNIVKGKRKRTLYILLKC